MPRINNANLAPLIGLLLLASATTALAAPVALNDLARRNVEAVIDFLRTIGDNAEADNIQQWLDDDKIKMDPDLGDDTGAETDSDGNITVRQLNIATVDLSRHSSIVNASGLASLAALLAHEKYHAHGSDKWLAHEWGFQLSLHEDPWEIGGYTTELVTLMKALQWLREEFQRELALYNPLVEEFNSLADEIAEGQAPQKQRMLELLDRIDDERHQLQLKANGLVDIVINMLSRAKQLKQGNHEKEDYLYDDVKEEWEALLEALRQLRGLVADQRETIEDWQAWLEVDPPPLPPRLAPPRIGPAPDASHLESKLRAANDSVATRAAMSMTEAFSVARDFFNALGKQPLPSDRVNLQIYTDVSYHAWYNREPVIIGLTFENGKWSEAGDARGPTSVVATSESAILRVLASADPQTAFDVEVRKGQVRLPSTDGPRPPRRYTILMVAVLVSLVVGFLVARALR